MLVYLFVLFVAIVYCALKKAHYKTNIFWLLFILIFLSGFRYMVGIDFPNYKIGYDYPDYLIAEQSWHIINSFFKGLGFTSQIFFIYTTLVIVICTYSAIKRYDRSIMLYAMLIFVSTSLYIESMNLVRQYVAMAIALLAFVNRLNNRPITYIILLILAFLLHKTAIICLPVFELSRLRFSKLFMILVVLVSIITGKFIVNSLLNVATSYLDSSFSYYTYLNNKSEIVVSSGMYQYFLNLLAIYFIYSRKSEYENNKRYSTVLNLFVVSVVLYNVFLYFDVGIRLAKYFFIFIIFLIPEHFKNSKGYTRIIELGIMALFILFTVKLASGSQYNPFLFNFAL